MLAPPSHCGIFFRRTRGADGGSALAATPTGQAPPGSDLCSPVWRRLARRLQIAGRRLHVSKRGGLRVASLEGRSPSGQGCGGPHASGRVPPSGPVSARMPSSPPAGAGGGCPTTALSGPDVDAVVPRRRRTARTTRGTTQKTRSSPTAPMTSTAPPAVPPPYSEGDASVRRVSADDELPTRTT